MYKDIIASTSSDNLSNNSNYQKFLKQSLRERTELMQTVLESDQVHTMTPEEREEFINRIGITPQVDYIWCAIRDASAYALTSVCGRIEIARKMRTGVSRLEIEEKASFHYRPGDWVRYNPNANWWSIYFSPMTEVEDRPKIWIRFPDDEELYWFFINGYNTEDGFILEPNPRTVKSMKLFKRYDNGNEFKNIVTSYPKSIAYNRQECYKAFEREGIIRTDKSDLEINESFLIYPRPIYKSGYGESLHLRRFQDDDFRKWKR